MCISAVCLFSASIKADAASAKPKWIGNSKAYVSFGTYPQTEVTGKKLTKAITSASYNKNGYAKVHGITYKRITKADASLVQSGASFYDWSKGGYRYFKCESITWKVLKTSGKNVILMANQVIDCQPFHTVRTSCNWKSSSIRKWLNTV